MGTKLLPQVGGRGPAPHGLEQGPPPSPDTCLPGLPAVLAWPRLDTASESNSGCPRPSPEATPSF